MKKIILGASFAIFATSCLAQNAYKISGTTSSSANGKKIYLKSAEGGSAILDSTMVSNGKFEFSGSQKVLFARVGLAEKEATPVVVALDGEVTVTLKDGEAEVSGTKVNNTLNELKNKTKATEKEMKDAYDLYKRLTKEENLDTAAIQKAISVYDAAEEKLLETQKSFARNNLNSPVAALIVSLMLNDLSADEINEFATAKGEFQNHPSMAKVRDYAEKIKNRQIGARFADFTMNDVDGKPHKMSEYVGNGKVVLVDFWASWCGPCRKEMPNVVEAYKKFHDKGFEILGISLDSKKDAWVRAISQLGITWPQLSDLKGWQCSAAALYGVRAIPATILYDGDGKVVATDLRGEKLAEKLAELLK